jgi:hypothetical protein
LPFRNIHSVISIINFFFANLLEVLPLLALMLTHYISLGRLIVFGSSHIVYEASFPILFTYIDSPHFELFAALSLLFILSF